MTPWSPVAGKNRPLSPSVAKWKSMMALPPGEIPAATTVRTSTCGIRMLLLAKVTVSNPHQCPFSNNLREDSRGSSTRALVCGEEQLSLWMTVQLDGGRHPTQQRVGVTQMNPANILAGVTLPPILLNLAASQSKTGAGKGKAPWQRHVTPAGTRMKTALEEFGTTLAPREAAPHSTLEGGVMG